MPPELDEIETSQTDENKERQLTPREIAMNAITVVREKDDDAPDINARQVDAQLALQNDAPRVLTDGLDKTLVTVKVDGVEQQIPVADVVRSYQKDAAATQRLAEASRLLEQARHQAEAAAKPPAQVDDAGAGKDTTVNPTSAETLGEFVDTLFEGDRDKAVAALAKLGIAGRTESPTLDLEELEAQLTPRIRQQLIDDSALERFEQANADIAADPHLVTMTNGFIQEAVNGGKPYAQALEVGVQRTRDWLGKLGVTTAQPNPSPTTSQPSKLERKAGIDEVQALNRTANTSQSAPDSPSQVIAAMRKARGQE